MLHALLPLALCLVSVSDGTLARERVPVLVVSGANNHDWRWTGPSLVSILTESGLFEVELTTDPAALFARTEQLARYRALVLDYNGPRWGAAAEANFLAAVEAGTGVVVVHAADNAFPGWDEYERLVGLLWREGTGHGSFHPFDVAITDRGHPLTADLPDLSAHPDELYHRLVNTQGATPRVLATAYSDPATGGTGQHEPMLLVDRHGRGRVVHTPLGHVWTGNEPSRASHRDPQFRNLIVRATDWAATGRVRDGSPRPNQVNRLQRAAGWEPLFDGRSFDGWRRAGARGAPEQGWEIVAGALRHVAGGGGGDLVSQRSFQDFELAFEWKTARGANSGVKYRVTRESEGSVLGPEYQVLDDGAHADGAHALKSAGALYAVVPASGAALAPVGAYNQGTIRARGTRLEHGLNGTLVAAADQETSAWSESLASSKFAGVADFARGAGPIALQDHGNEVWFRSILVRDLMRLPGRAVQLFDGSSLAGWERLGDARYAAEDGSIVGEVEGGGQSFLASERHFGDFLLELDLRMEVAGNSGIQIRSHVRENGRLFGYQIEIDPSDRAWSGGLYDEARRGWLQNLEGREAARAAFDRRGWNHYRIEAVGPWIRTWVNGVPVTDWFDAADLEGRIALQVHSGQAGRLRWKNLRLQDLGTRAWQDVTAAAAAVEGTCLLARGDEFTSRARFRGPAQVRLSARERDAAPRWIDLGRLESFDAQGENELALMLHAPRLALSLNGTNVIDERDVEAVRDNVLELVLGESATLLSAERMGEPE